MEEKDGKLAIINEIYSHFTEENKEKLVKTAKKLLKVQNEDSAMVADAVVSQKEKGIV